MEIEGAVAKPSLIIIIPFGHSSYYCSQNIKEKCTNKKEKNIFASKIISA
jgi:hypothetical protein